MINLVGFENQFNNVINNYKIDQLHSSILIHGPKGIGKKSFTNMLISEIFKYHFNEANFSHHYNLFISNTHPNIRIIERIEDQKTKKIKSQITIDQIRNLKTFIYESPSINNLPKFIIIDSVDDLNINAANSFLKNLEEPCKNTYIFLISHHLSSLIPTIRSRCLKIKLTKHNFVNFKNIIYQQISNINEDEINLLYDLTYGSPGNAILLYNSDILKNFERTLISLSDNDLNNDKLELADNLSKLDNDQFKSYLSLLKYLLIILSKYKYNIDSTNNFLTDNIKLLKNCSKLLTLNNIIDRFEFLINNENDLFTYNLDKKLFMLKFLTN